jgi:hypothetical protein
MTTHVIFIGFVVTTFIRRGEGFAEYFPYTLRSGYLIVAAGFGTVLQGGQEEVEGSAVAGGVSAGAHVHPAFMLLHDASAYP